MCLNIKVINFNILVLALILIFGATGSGCNVFREGGRGGRAYVCAQVNGKSITIEDFERELLRLNIDKNEPHIESDEQIKLLKKELLLFMIDRELLILEAKSMGINISQEEIDVYLKDLAMGYPPERFPIENHLKSFTFEEQCSLISDGLLIRRLIQKIIEPALSVNEEEKRSFFLSHKKEFERTREFRVRQIVVESEIEAREIQDLLRKGYDFEEIARQRSLGPEKEEGGDLGFFELDQMPPEFDDVAGQLKEGEISDVFQTDYGCHIFKLVETRETQVTNWEDAEPRLTQILLAKKRDEAFHDWLVELRTRADIKIYPKTIYRGI
ncbi:peptidylprolyl isomerase [bacterium]|nr:peptidylprolyl isomerase [bacterium]